MAWRMARQDVFLLFVMACSVVLGVTALVGLSSLEANFRSAIDAQARPLLGADYVISSRVALNEEAQAFIDAQAGERADEHSFASMLVLPNTEGDFRSRLVQVNALSGRYPFYGEFTTEPSEAAEHFLNSSGGEVLLEHTLMLQYGIRLGDVVRLGRSRFKVLGAVHKVPGSTDMRGMIAPRVYMRLSDLEATGLIQRGSRVRYKSYFKALDSATFLSSAVKLKKQARSLGLSFRSYEDRRESIQNVSKRVYQFLDVMAFIAILLTGVGIATACSQVVRRKIRSVSVLRCIGVSSRVAVSIFVLQVCTIGVVSVLVGCILGVLLQTQLPLMLESLLPVKISFFIAWDALLLSAVISLSLLVAFSLLPLLSTRLVSPLVALRLGLADDVPRDPLRILLGMSTVLVVAGAAVVHSGSPYFGVASIALFFVAILALWTVSKCTMFLVRRVIPKGMSYAIRQGFANLYRPYNYTSVLLIAIGLSVFLLTVTLLSRESVLGSVQATGEGARPNLAFFDVQVDQRAMLKDIFSRFGLSSIAEVPMVTMRLVEVKGVPIASLRQQAKVKDIPEWSLTREYRSTYRDRLDEGESLVDGRLIPRVDDETKPIPVTLEQGIAKRLKMGIGDELRFNVQGVELHCVVSGIRTVTWQQFRPNFFVVFPLGILEQAPQTIVTVTRAEQRVTAVEVQQAVVTQMPNVSVVDLSLVISTVDGVIDKLSAIVQTMSMVTVVAGILILLSVIYGNTLQRSRENTLLKILGASKHTVRIIITSEYCFLGIIGATSGIVLALLCQLLLGVYVFGELSAYTPMSLFGPAVVAVVMTVGIGLVGAGRIYR